MPEWFHVVIPSGEWGDLVPKESLREKQLIFFVSIWRDARVVE